MSSDYTDENNSARPRWHAMPVEDVLSQVGSRAEGLSTQEADDRLRRYGPNRLEETPSASRLKMLLDEFTSPLILILLASAVLLFIVARISSESEHNVDAALILAIVIFNAGIGFVQNHRAQKGIEALQRMSQPSATVHRDGRTLTLSAASLVVGDVVSLEEGDHVPADGRIMEAYDLHADESSLTGESLPVAKSSAVCRDDTILAERSAMMYMGTAMLRGRGRAVITDTGMSTQMGGIAKDIQSVEEGPTQFQREVGTLGKRITYIIGVIIAAVAALQLTLGGLGPVEVFITAVALAVAAIPEGLPVVLTLALAFGTRRMLSRHALVRSLPVVETVGAAQVICSDKTGTITEGRMGMRVLYQHGVTLDVTGGAMDSQGQFAQDGQPTDQSGSLAMLACGLCNNALYQDEGGFSGDPTEIALLAASMKAGVDARDWRRTDEIPFSSERKMMSVVVEGDGRRLMLAKGAPELIFDRCTSISQTDGDVPLDDEGRQQLVAANNQMASQGLRVLALAYRALDDSEAADPPEDNMAFLGLAGISDPPREAVRHSMTVAQAAGIRVVMITGDNSLTATAIAHDVGLDGVCLEGRALDDMDDSQLADTVDEVSIFARAEPRHKLRILQQLRREGQVVVMTGDGVNDAPALKGADVGIAMGIRGTEVARDASDIVLMDDNFASIVAAVEEGRRVFNNIKKFITYLLIGNLAEVMVIFIASLFGQLPVTAVQILWINLVTDGIPAIALGMDPAPPGMMRRPPNRTALLGRETLTVIGAVGAVQTLVILATFVIGLNGFAIIPGNAGMETAVTMVFMAFPLQEFVVLAVLRRREGGPLLANRWLGLAVALSLALQLAIIYSPLNVAFDAVPLGFAAWGVLLAGLVLGYLFSLAAIRLVDRPSSEEEALL